MADPVRTVTLVAPTPPPFAGPEVLTEQLLDSQLNSSFDLIHVRSNIKFSNSEKGAFSMQATLRQVGIYWEILKSRFAGSRKLYLLVGANLFAFLKDAGSIWLGKLLGMRVIAHIQGATLPAFHAQTAPLMQWLIQATLEAPDVFIVQGRAIRESLVSHFGVDPERVLVIPSMVSMPDRPCRLTDEPLQILFLGHLAVGKGFYDLIAVLDDILERYPDVSFSFAGEIKEWSRDYVARWLAVEPPSIAEKTRVEALLRENEAQMKYAGIVAGEEKHELLCRADIFVLPSYSESSPLSLLEAMSHSCAVIATNVGGVPEIIEHEKNGLIIDPGNREGLRLAITRLITDSTLREELGNAAQAKVREDFGTEAILPLYEDAFNSLHDRQ